MSSIPLSGPDRSGPYRLVKSTSTAGRASGSEAQDLAAKALGGRVGILEQVEGGKGLRRQLVIGRERPWLVDGAQHDGNRLCIRARIRVRGRRFGVQLQPGNRIDPDVVLPSLLAAWTTPLVLTHDSPAANT